MLLKLKRPGAARVFLGSATSFFSTGLGAGAGGGVFFLTGGAGFAFGGFASMHILQQSA
jgi:hypothetical protein